MTRHDETAPPRLPRTATVHERTVQAAAEHLHRPTRRRPTTTRPRPTTVTWGVKVDPRVWAAALHLAGRDVARIEVRSAAEVVVHNHPTRATAIRRAAIRGDAAA